MWYLICLVGVVVIAFVWMAEFVSVIDKEQQRLDDKSERFD